MLDAALDELLEHGYERVTMLGIARRAGASKETLYNWFGSKEGLFGELITRNADASAAAIESALGADQPAYDTLVGYATGLLSLLTGPGSLALNRAAMSAPDLASALLAQGRHRVGPIVERYLAHLVEQGVLVAVEPGQAFELLYGLVVQDVQIRVLLGESPPSAADVATRAREAVDRFVVLVGA